MIASSQMTLTSFIIDMTNTFGPNSTLSAVYSVHFLFTTPVLEKITKYRHNWAKHVHRVNNSRFPKALIEYHPRGRRRPGRPLKSLIDGVQIETKTGHVGLIS
jgi:hypothetical protein